MESKKEKERQRHQDNIRPRDREIIGWTHREKEAEMSHGYTHIDMERET